MINIEAQGQKMMGLIENESGALMYETMMSAMKLLKMKSITPKTLHTIPGPGA